MAYRPLQRSHEAPAKVCVYHFSDEISQIMAALQKSHPIDKPGPHTGSKGTYLPTSTHTRGKACGAVFMASLGIDPSGEGRQRERKSRNILSCKL